ncbi:hypothetical protein CON36_35195 [Bacillus cereus]|uniref:Uncharacterized protein n=1 Tax=Bacillus cereus TaxID=1396 RepID=A0A9X6SS38_BACCE|nr:hypothetical protein [Bacillus cereus]PDZ94180.1 hypothetical protein CON36_35195 [Bacillus cereus]
MKKLGTFGMALTIVGLLLVILVAKNEFCGPNNIIEVKPQAEDFQKEIEKSKKNPYEGMVIHDYTERIPYQPEESMQIWEQWYK